MRPGVLNISHPETTMRIPFAALPALLALASPAGASELLRFQVLLDDKPIGEHSFRIDARGERTEVTSRAAFDVDFLFLTAYRYRHTSSEVFRDGCLTEIRASTDDNGKAFQVQGSAADGGFNIEHTGGSEQADGCLMTFAYWDPAFLDQDRLLNPQTGEIEPVRVRRAGTEAVEVDGRELAATRYALTAGNGEDRLTIDLWYHDELGWVGLESDTGKGKRIVYRRL